MKTGTWAAGAADDPAVTLETFQEKLPVRLIATPRSVFKTCRADEELSVVVAHNEERFDHFPVVERVGGSTQERIIGLLEVIPFMRGTEPRGLVRDHMRPLWEENLIGADASLLTFIRNADRQMCRLVVSGPEINGLVTLSDLHQLPVRAALFAMVTQLEITMAEAIRREFNQSTEWMGRLSAKRKCKVQKDVAEAKTQDTFVDDLLYTQFCDKVTIVKKSPDFRWSKTSFAADLDKVQSLRDNIAHANDYAAKLEDARQVCETVRLMDYWIERLASWRSGPDNAVKGGRVKLAGLGPKGVEAGL
jgi:hypothetical protein